MAPAKNGNRKKKSHSIISDVVTREYTIHIHKHIHSVSFKKCASWELKEIQKFALEEVEIPDVCIDTRFSKAVWAKGIRNVPYRLHTVVQRT
ncbi:unnamed protein product [Gulo gulo]|uniref:Large ribosomal subunit protein eL31 n=1 Tax=Gulo gulo TaxID=48420 RepID=A0A9X9M5J2_GULGU|nr:unnamed protein product [Gulo gulo]